MTLINTYTAVPCGQAGGTYEVAIAAALLVKEGNLGAVLVSSNPPTYVCCAIDRSQINQTDSANVKPVEDSGYKEDECEDCQTHWSESS